MPPKRNAKRKTPEPSSPKCNPDKAPEPVIANTLGPGTAPERVVVYGEIVRVQESINAVPPSMPALEDLPTPDANLLASIQI